MKRITLMCLFLGVVCCVIMACKGNERKSEAQQPLEKSNETEQSVECAKTFKISDDEFISMQIIPEKVSINSSNVWRMENKTKKFMSYGKQFSLEYFDKNNWMPIQFQGNFGWEEILLGLSAGETIEEPMSFYLIGEYNDGKKGRYRVIRKVSLQSDRMNNADAISFTLCAEFEIE